MRKIKVVFAKVGNIGCSPLLEFLLDERAEREDVEVRVFGSGSKMDPESCASIAEEAVKHTPDLIVFTTPNASLQGPAKAREIFQESKIPTVIVSDNPAKKAAKAIEEAGLGYIIVEGDIMIGARREFLDPVEMACFNSDIIKVLAVTGVFEVLRTTINRLILTIKKGEKIELPHIIVSKDKAVNEAGFTNPYAKAKAASAYEMVRRAGDLTFEGCFVEKDWRRYVELVCAGHEIVRAAAQLADEAREIEKASDTLIRRPHSSEGLILQKRRLIEKPSSPG
ncbi:MAG: F420-dependent methylenetetrahydromethanopterin dehydrogenase [Candidatus Bathyarchaeia archaeon]